MIGCEVMILHQFILLFKYIDGYELGEFWEKIDSIVILSYRNHDQQQVSKNGGG